MDDKKRGKVVKTFKTKVYLRPFRKERSSGTNEPSPPHQMVLEISFRGEDDVDQGGGLASIYGEDPLGRRFSLPAHGEFKEPVLV